MLTTSSGTERLIGLIYDAESETRRWVYVLKELQHSLDADAVSLCDFDFSHREGRIVDSIGYNQSYLRSYTETYASSNIWLQEPFYIPSGQVHLGEEILSETQLVQTKFYVEWLQPQGLSHRICAVVKHVDRRAFYLEALRSKANPPYDQQTKLFLSSLLPHFQQAMKRNIYFWQLAVIKDVIDSWPCALIAVDKYARPLIMNRAAEQIVQDEGIFRSSLEGLSLTGIKSGPKFQKLIVTAASNPSPADGGCQECEAMIIPRRNHRTPAWLVVTPLGRKLRPVVCQEVEIALVYIYLPEFLGPLQKRMLMSSFKLTPAEQRLVQLILEGCRLDEASEKLGISRNTARTHMKRIYSKTKTGCQTDLVRLLLGGPWGQMFPAPLGSPA